MDKNNLSKSVDGMRPSTSSGKNLKKLKSKNYKLKHDISASTGVNTTVLEQTQESQKKSAIFDRATDEEMEEAEYINDISIINTSSKKLDK